MNSLRQRLDSQRLSKTGYTFQQHMPIAQQADQQPVQHLMLPDDHPSNLVPQPVDKGRLVLDLTVQLSDILCCIKHNRIIGGPKIRILSKIAVSSTPSALVV